MEETKNQHKPKGTRKDPGELRVVSIDFNPGPDAQDRLRRLFSLLVKYAVRDRQLPPRADSSPDGGGEGGLVRFTHSLTVISLGGGVQSSVMALMASQGAFDAIPNCAIFADTHWEPPSLYTHLDWLAERLGFPVYVVDNGRSLREDVKTLTNHSGNHSFVDLPLYLKGRNGHGDGIGRRQCTEHYKIRPIQRKIRELLGLTKGQRVPSGTAVSLWLGISTDKAIRMKPSRDRWIQNRYPLIEAGMSGSNALRGGRPATTGHWSVQSASAAHTSPVSGG